MLYARKVLADCKKAHSLLESEEDDDIFRILWVSGVALARAVGHVLDKVDAQRDDRMAAVIRQKYTSWKQDRQTNSVFWDFIEDERNRILKEYEHRFLAEAVSVVAGSEEFPLSEHLFNPLTDGAFAGEDCRDVLELAIQWWERELSEIEGMYPK